MNTFFPSQSSTVRLILSSLVFSSCSWRNSDESLQGEVVRIADGDTITVRHERKEKKVRLKGVDCPEKTQAYGVQAKRLTESLSYHRKVTVRLSEGDRYGRLLGEVTLPNGRVLNQELVGKGLCWWYKAYAPKDEVLKQLQFKAHALKLGLWKDPHPVPPWEFRQLKRKKKDDSTKVEAEKRLSTPRGIIIGNKDSHIFHKPECPGYSKVKPERQMRFTSEEEAQKEGYRIAKNCR